MDGNSESWQKKLCAIVVRFSKNAFKAFAYCTVAYDVSLLQAIVPWDFFYQILPFAFFTGLIWVCLAIFMLTKFARSNLILSRVRMPYLFLVLVLCVSIGRTLVPNPLPSSAELESHFRRHEKEYGELAALAKVEQDGTSFDTHDLFWDGSRIPRDLPFGARLQRTILLLRVDTAAGYHSNDYGSIDFKVWYRHDFIGATGSSGIAYCPTLPHPIEKTIDGRYIPSHELTVVYQHVKGPWYLFVRGSYD